MTTENRRYNVPDVGATDWYEPVNENWHRIDEDVQDLYDRIHGDGGDSDGFPGTYDIYVYQEEDEYWAVTADGTVVDSGRDGNVVLQSGLDGCPERGVVVFEGHFEISSTLRPPHSLWLIGKGRPTIETTIDGGWGFDWRADEFTVDVTSDISFQDWAIDVSSTNDINVGDIVCIETTDLFTDSGSREEHGGEAHRVRRVRDDRVTLGESVIFERGYESSKTRVRVVKPAEFHFRYFDVVGGGTDSNDTNPSEEYRGMHLTGVIDSTFEGLHFKYTNDRGFQPRAMGDSVIRNCRFEHMMKESDGYGIQFTRGCFNCVVENSTAQNCRHSLSITPVGSTHGISRGIVFRTCFVSGDLSAAANVHDGGAHSVSFLECDFQQDYRDSPEAPNSNRLMRVSAAECRVIGCRFWAGSQEESAISDRGSVSSIGSRWVIRNCDIYNANRAITFDSDQGISRIESLIIDNVRVRNSRRLLRNFHETGYLQITNCVTDRMEHGGEATIFQRDADSALIANNRFGNDPAAHIDLTAQKVQIVGNKFSETGDDQFIRLSNSRDIFVSNNQFSGSVSRIVTETGNSGSNVYVNNHLIDGAPNRWDIDSSSVVENNF